MGLLGPATGLDATGGRDGSKETDGGMAKSGATDGLLSEEEVDGNLEAFGGGGGGCECVDVDGGGGGGGNGEGLRIFGGSARTFGMFCTDTGATHSPGSISLESSLLRFFFLFFFNSSVVRLFLRTSVNEGVGVGTGGAGAAERRFRGG